MPSIAGLRTSSKRVYPAAGAAILVAMFVAAHLALLNLPSVNLEFAFSDAARFFSTGEPQYLQQYFHYEANTLAVPWLAFAIGLLFPAVPVDYIPRLLSVVGIPFLAVGLLRINRRLQDKTDPCRLISIVLLNPLVWTFSGRGTADFLPAALAMFSLSLFPHANGQPGIGLSRRMFASAVLGVAAVLKYHALLLLVAALVETLIVYRHRYRAILLALATAAVPAVLIVTLYLVAVRTAFGFWVVPPSLRPALSINLGAGLDNLVSYSGYLVLLTVPLSLTAPWRRLTSAPARLTAVVLFLPAVFIIGYFFLSDNGEMNFGPLDPYVDKRVANGVLAMLGGVMFVRLAMVWREVRWTQTVAVAGVAAIAFFLLMLSVTTPAQRYLLFVLPFFYLFAVPRRDHRLAVAAALLLSVALDAYITLNQVASGVASVEMARRITDLGLLSKTLPQAIEANVGNRFFPYRDEKKSFVVVAGDVDGKIAGVHYSPVPLMPFIGKTYSLVRLGPDGRL